jgi:hypothetical protein
MTKVKVKKAYAYDQTRPTIQLLITPYVAAVKRTSKILYMV